MGNCNSKKKLNDKNKKKRNEEEPSSFFEHGKWLEHMTDEIRAKKLDPSNKRLGVLDQPVVSSAAMLSQKRNVKPIPAPVTVPSRSYDDEAIDRMRNQLNNDSEAFLLNNILLSVQFFENYEREKRHIKSYSTSNRDQRIDEAMVRHHKHVYGADRILECVQRHVRYSRHKGQLESLSSPRLFVIYDNVEVSEPGDMSDYSTVLDAPFYKLLIEDSKESGFAKLKKLEVLESVVNKDDSSHISQKNVISDDSVYTDSEKESNCSDEFSYPTTGEALLEKIQSSFMESHKTEKLYKSNVSKINDNSIDITKRKPSGPIKNVSTAAVKGDISNLKLFRHNNDSDMLEEEIYEKNEIKDKVRKSILKNSNINKKSVRDTKVQLDDKYTTSSENIVADDTETSGYRSNSSRNNESSETESDYGYATIRQSTTPKRVELSLQSNLSASSGVLPEECWTTVKVWSVDEMKDDDDEDEDDEDKNLKHDTYDYLDSINFMTNFVDNFVVKLGTALGLTTDAINNALTQGASIYCDATKGGVKFGYEIMPALIAAWPNGANQWIIRQRKINTDPRTKFNYQWPTKAMVDKTRNFGCFIIPIGYRPKKGLNLKQKFQWKIIFPAAERYLESCLAHSHIRCYLFTLALQKTFMENETAKIGIDSSHIKNHLFWLCEDNNARFPEDRLGESLRLFIRTFYENFARNYSPNYFIENCNDFKGIPMTLLRKLQHCLREIMESPVIHMLIAIQKLKYTSKDFYPQLNVKRLYNILTCKNPLRLLNPDIQIPIKQQTTSESDDDENHNNIFDKAKAHDRNYQIKRARQRQAQERRKAIIYAKKHKTASKMGNAIERNVKLPAVMDIERRRLVFEFFIPHFIAMARYSEKFEAINQAVIYLEQAQRLCMLLLEQAAAETTANEYLDVIRDDLTECRRKLINQTGYILPSRTEKNQRDINNVVEKIPHKRPKFIEIVNQDSPTDSPGIAAFTYNTDMNAIPSTSGMSRINSIKLMETDSEDEESRL